MRNIGEFWSLPKAIAEIKNLSMADKLVFAVLWTRRNGENEAWPSFDSISNSLGISKRSVIYSVNKLTQEGWIVAVKGGGRGRSNIYQIVPEDEMVQNLHSNKRVQPLREKGARNVSKRVQPLQPNRTIEKNNEKNIGTPSQQMRSFIESSNVKGNEYAAIIGAFERKGVPRSVAEREITKFLSYWTEPNKSGSKQRWELQPTFDVRRRLVTWFGNVQNFIRQRETKGVRI